MRRVLYQILLWLHPPSFRQQFGPEMLWIFDETNETALLIDCLTSLARQWLLRSGLWKFALAIALAAAQVWTYLRWSSSIWVLRRTTASDVSPENLLAITTFALAFVIVMTTAVVIWAQVVRRKYVA